MMQSSSHSWCVFLQSCRSVGVSMCLRADEQTFGAYPSFVSVCFYFWSIPVYWVCVFASLHVTSIRLYSLYVMFDDFWRLQVKHSQKRSRMSTWETTSNSISNFAKMNPLDQLGLFFSMTLEFWRQFRFSWEGVFFQDPRWPPNGGDFVFEYCRLAPELSIVVWQYQCFTILWGMLKKNWIPRVFEAFWAYP